MFWVLKRTISLIMSLKLDIVSAAPFKVLGEQISLAQKWDQYVKRFDYQSIRGDSRGEKRALLLHVSGDEVQNLFDTQHMSKL